MISQYGLVSELRDAALIQDKMHPCSYPKGGLSREQRACSTQNGRRAALNSGFCLQLMRGKLGACRMLEDNTVICVNSSACLSLCKQYELLWTSLLALSTFDSVMTVIWRHNHSYSILLLLVRVHSTRGQQRTLKKMNHMLKWVTLLTNNLFLFIAHPPVTLKYCCDRLSLSFIRQWLVSVTSDLFCHCERGIFHRIQWLKGGNRLIKVAWCHCCGVRNRQHHNLQ